MSATTRLLGRLTGRRRPSTKADTVTALATPAGPIDGAAWYTEHERLSYDLISTMARANVGPITALGKHNRQVTSAQAALLAHARLISGAQEPILMAKDGVHTIPFQKLADARAQIQVLEAELAKLRTQGDRKPKP
jgi:hypothetical protein